MEWAHRYVKPDAWGNVVAYIEESKKDVKKQAWKKRWLLAAIGIVLLVATAISLVLMFQANAAKAAAQHALRVSPKSLLCRHAIAEWGINLGGFQSLEHEVQGTDPQHRFT